MRTCGPRRVSPRSPRPAGPGWVAHRCRRQGLATWVASDARSDGRRGGRPGGAQAALESRGRREALGGAEVEALGVVGADGLQDAERVGVLDALGDRALVQAASDAHDRLDDLVVKLRAGQLADEAHIDLQVASRDVLEEGEGGEAGAEVV